MPPDLSQMAFCHGLFIETRLSFIFELSQKLWELIDDLLQVVIDMISKTGKVDLREFKNSKEYNYLKELFESSFLSNQIKGVYNTA